MEPCTGQCGAMLKLESRDIAQPSLVPGYRICSSGEGAAGMCETSTAGEKRRLAHLGSTAAQDFLAGDSAEQLCAELRAYRRLQHVANILHKQPHVALVAQWQQLREFVKAMRADDVQLLHTQLLTK